MTETVNILNASLDAVDPQQWTSELASMTTAASPSGDVAGRPSIKPSDIPLNFSWSSHAFDGSSEYKSSYRPWEINVVKPTVHHRDSITSDAVNYIDPSQWKSEYQATMMGRANKGNSTNNFT